MSHNIEINNGVASFVENGRKERAWHGLGQVFDRPMTVQEALSGCHADYRVQAQPIVALTPEILACMENGTAIDPDLLLSQVISNRKATMRMDSEKPLGVVSDTYGVVQNEDAFKFIDTLCTGSLSDYEHTPIIESAGVLGHGERVFVTAKFPEKVILDNKGNDLVEMYLVFTTSHDGTGAVNCMVTPIRVVCNNTLNMAMSHNSGKLSLKHTSRVMSRLDLQDEENRDFAYKALNLYDVYTKSLKDAFKHLANVKLAEKDLERILAEVALSDKSLDVYKRTGNIYHEDIATRGKNIVLGMMEATHGGVGQDVCESGTAMWLLNGISTYYQNGCNFQSDEVKFRSLQDGYAAKNLQKAYDLCMAL